ncbi:MAG TPA: hypothetical protein VFN61_08810 [Acidimicrobiales bacterium]|nr:hypothetical protein [Acidimicrobiales bacterium]
MLLFRGHLGYLEVGLPWDLPASRSAWVTSPDEPDGFTAVFANGIASVSVVRAGNAPRLARRQGARAGERSLDIKVVVKSTNKWVWLPIHAGRWQLYTDDPGGVDVVAVSCPTS